jgi:5-methylcytosine-specific restriction protein B
MAIAPVGEVGKQVYGDQEGILVIADHLVNSSGSLPESAQSDFRPTCAFSVRRTLIGCCIRWGHICHGVILSLRRKSSVDIDSLSLAVWLESASNMSLQSLMDVVYSSDVRNWKDNNEKAFKSLFGSPQGRYPSAAERVVQLRAPDIGFDVGVPFAAYIHPNNAKSGPYGGFSFVVFPTPGGPALLGLVVGTQGLAPDEAILGKPGHARKAQAVCAWLNRRFGEGKLVAWAKQDPTRTDLQIPDQITNNWPEFKGAFDAYGRVMYAVFKPNNDRAVTTEALSAFLDLTFEERGILPNSPHRASRDKIRSQWFDRLMPQLSHKHVAELLKQKRFVVIQGPPGTGKTTMAQELLKNEYDGRGRSIQLHPNTTYEMFIGGLAPEQSDAALGLQFRPKPGFLMQAAQEALKVAPKPYLLHVDEINRADLSKILGEAIYLLESKPLLERTIILPYDFGEPFNSVFKLPENLFILGTMNSADRSIAIVDVAIRRRFAFVSLWPQMSVVKSNACDLMQEAFKEIIDIFVEHAQGDAFNLVPGHSYFLENDEEKARISLNVGLVPLLEEYLAQGYVGGFSEPIRSYLQWVRSLQENG